MKQLMVNFLLLARVAQFVDLQSKEFSHKLPHIWQALKQFADRNSGAIRVDLELSGNRLVSSELSSFANRSETKYETVSIAVISGLTFFKRPRRTWVTKVESCLEALRQIPDGEGDAPMEELIARGDNEPTVTAGMVLRNLERALRLAGELDDASAFFAAENLTTIEAWGYDQRNMLPFKTERFGSQVHIIAPDLGRARLNVMCPELPNLSLLKRVVADGSALSGLLRE